MLIKYRPDIDGLRGIATFGVIFYALPPNNFNPNHWNLSVGYLGVDIFFYLKLKKMRRSVTHQPTN